MSHNISKVNITENVLSWDGLSFSRKHDDLCTFVTKSTKSFGVAIPQTPNAAIRLREITLPNL